MMWLQILHGTPAWVFVLLAVLLALGLSQWRMREVPWARVVGIALGMTAFSVYGTLTAFGRTPLALAGWLVGAASVMAWLATQPVPTGTRYDAVLRRFTLPGSGLPLALMMTIFFTKYGVAVALAMHPTLHNNLQFALPACSVYGACSGAFAGRAMRLWRWTLANSATGDETRAAPIRQAA